METLDGLLFELDYYSAINVERLIADKVENIFVRVGLEKTDNRVEVDYMKVYRSRAQGEEVDTAIRLHEELKSLFFRYIDTWGDSEDMRLAVILIASGLDFISMEEFEDCIAVLEDVWNAGFPPAALVAAATATKEAAQQEGVLLSSSGGIEADAVKGKFLFDTWHQGLRNAWSELDLGSIKNSPKDVFKEFLRPYIAEQLDVCIADICEQDRLDTEGIY